MALCPRCKGALPSPPFVLPKLIHIAVADLERTCTHCGAKLKANMSIMVPNMVMMFAGIITIVMLGQLVMMYTRDLLFGVAVLLIFPIVVVTAIAVHHYRVGWVERNDRP